MQLVSQFFSTELYSPAHSGHPRIYTLRDRNKECMTYVYLSSEASFCTAQKASFNILPTEERMIRVVPEQG